MTLSPQCPRVFWSEVIEKKKTFGYDFCIRDDKWVQQSKTSFASEKKLFLCILLFVAKFLYKDLTNLYFLVTARSSYYKVITNLEEKCKGKRKFYIETTDL